ncbi:MAG: hypothetical protein ACN6O7_12630, partial [Sphingobacterium sp.]
MPWSISTGTGGHFIPKSGGQYRRNLQSHANFQQTFNSGNYGEKITRLCAESSFILKQQQQIDLLLKSAKERYMELVDTKKGIERIPLKYLASYLGITPQSLSRLRSQKI